LAVSLVIALPTRNPARRRSGVIDHPIALAGELSSQRVQRDPKFSRGRDGCETNRESATRNPGIGKNAQHPRLAIPSDFAGRNLGKVSSGAIICERRQHRVLCLRDGIAVLSDKRKDAFRHCYPGFRTTNDDTHLSQAA
jgi:hypothetical protein